MAKKTKKTKRLRLRRFTIFSANGLRMMPRRSPPSYKVGRGWFRFRDERDRKLCHNFYKIQPTSVEIQMLRNLIPDVEIKIGSVKDINKRFDLKDWDGQAVIVTVPVKNLDQMRRFCSL